MTAWEALQFWCLAVGGIATIITAILLGFAIGDSIRQWVISQDRQRHLDRVRRLEDMQVEQLDDLWHMPAARGH